MESNQLPQRPPKRSGQTAAPYQETRRPAPARRSEDTWAVSSVSRMAGGMSQAQEQSPRTAAPRQQSRMPQQSRSAGGDSSRYASPAAPNSRSSAPVKKAQSAPTSPQRMTPQQVVRRVHKEEMLQSTRRIEDSRERLKPEGTPLPGWLKVSIVACVLAVMACVAGELIITGWLNQQQQQREAAYQRTVQSHPLQYQDLIEKYSLEYNLQPAYVAAIILNESSYNSQAESGVGARGLMQLMPDTAEWIAHKLGMDHSWTADRLWEPEINIRFGCWYLNYLNSLFGGDPVTVTSAYHTGQGEVRSWLANSTYSPDGRALSLDTMPDGPTKVYAGRVTRDYGIYDVLYFHTFNEPVSADWNPA